MKDYLYLSRPQWKTEIEEKRNGRQPQRKLNLQDKQREILQNKLDGQDVKDDCDIRQQLQWKTKRQPQQKIT